MGTTGLGGAFIGYENFFPEFEDIVSADNLLSAWLEFLRGKRRKRDVGEFSLKLMENILALRNDLRNGIYKHGGYSAFNISDPKPRNIHKASVRDRLLHHAIYRVLYPFFDRKFIADSYSCRLGKGTHKALNRFRAFARKASKNNTKTCWVLKCDIRKFFANIDHAILTDILRAHIPDQKTLWLLGKVIGSFSSEKIPRGARNDGGSRIGLPLGNLTSQLFVNIYMNEFDQFVKHDLRAKYYIRYADDFVFFSENRAWLESLLPQVKEFLKEKLKLDLHPDKVYIKTLASGLDFLGWVHFPDYRVLRTATKKRMLTQLTANPSKSALASYQGMLKHGNARKLEYGISRFARND